MLQFITHHAVLISAAPDISRGYYRHSRVLRCEDFPSKEELAREKEGCELSLEIAATATAATTAMLVSLQQL